MRQCNGGGLSRSYELVMISMLIKCRCINARGVEFDKILHNNAATSFICLRMRVVFVRSSGWFSL